MATYLTLQFDGDGNLVGAEGLDPEGPGPDAGVPPDAVPELIGSLAHSSRPRAVALRLRPGGGSPDRWLQGGFRLPPAGTPGEVAVEFVGVDVSPVLEGARACGLPARSLPAALRHGADLVAVVDGEGMVRFHQEGAGRPFGHPAGELVGTRLLKHVHPDDWSDLIGVLQTIGQGEEEGGPRTVECRLREADGRWHRVEGRPVAAGEEAGMVLFWSLEEESAAGPAARLALEAGTEPFGRPPADAGRAGDVDPGTGPTAEAGGESEPSTRDAGRDGPTGASRTARDPGAADPATSPAPGREGGARTEPGPPEEAASGAAEEPAGGPGAPPRVEAAPEPTVDERLRVLDRALRATGLGVVVTDQEGGILWANPAFAEQTGHPVEEMLGDRPRIFRPEAHDEDFYREMRESVTGGESWSGEIVSQRSDGSSYVEEVTVVPVEEEDREGEVGRFVVFTRDVTERSRREDQLRRHALRDPLTDLVNRTLFEDRLEQAILRGRRRSATLAVLMIELEPAAGGAGTAVDDAAVEEMAGRLEGCMGEEDTLGRWEKDTFVVLLEELEAISELPAFLDRALPELEKPVGSGSRSPELDATIGAVICGHENQPGAIAVEEAGVLLRCAQRALYRAQRDPDATFHLFRPRPERPGERPRQVERRRDLRRGLDQGELEVYYQPVVRLTDGGVWGLETLARWRHPEEGLFSPAEFIPLAEQTGLIQELGRAIFERTRRDVAAWREAGLDLDALRILPNVSGRQFESGEIVDIVERYLAIDGLGPGQLWLEISEPAILRATGRIETLREIGARILVDDFGTGHASLLRLRDLEIDGLKAAMSFVQGLGEGRGNRPVLEAVLTLGRGMELPVIAEGVEKEAQLRALGELGCELAQGYLFARPMRRDRVPELLSQVPRAGSRRG